MSVTRHASNIQAATYVSWFEINSQKREWACCIISWHNSSYTIYIQTSLMAFSCMPSRCIIHRDWPCRMPNAVEPFS